MVLVCVLIDMDIGFISDSLVSGISSGLEFGAELKN
tara:strand:- start:370 stop:477 length:108 start_codon:yes stop_codon:yes gene_type:complete